MTEASLDRLLEEVQSLAATISKAQISSPSQKPAPKPGFTNKYFKAGAATHLFTGREDLLNHVKEAFILGASQSVDKPSQDEFDLSRSTTTMSTASTLVPSSRGLPEIDRQSSPDDTHSQKHFVIVGLGGSGKSEFCRKFCEANQTQ